MMNLAGIRAAIRTRSGVPEKGATGTQRLNDSINFALRHLWQDIPRVFLSEEYRLLLQQAITAGTVEVSPNDARVVRLDVTGVWPTDKTMDGRWMDILDGDGVWHTFRVRTIYATSTTADYGAGGVRDVAVLDAPWHTLGDGPFEYRLYCYEYPYPADVQGISGMIRDPETNPREMTEAMSPEELQRWRLGYGWHSDGIPEKWSHGDFHQLRSPHDKPGVALLGTVVPDTKWGYSSVTGDEHSGANAFRPFYEQAGTFSYRYCLVWGRLPIAPRGIHNRARLQYLAGEADKPPFLISAPSHPSANITTTWGGGAIQIVCSHQNWVDFEMPDDAFLSWNKSGLELWWFRARHARDTSGSPEVQKVESDGEYYLWRITAASTTEIEDHGETPAARYFPLKEYSGHRSVRFDKSPANATTQMLMNLYRRPDTLKADADMCRVPVDCLEAVVVRALSYLAGERDGNIPRSKYYKDEYDKELKRLRRLYTFARTPPTPFGDGMGDSPRYGNGSYAVKEQT